MYVFEAKFTGLPPSLNVQLRMHKNARQKMNQAWYQLVKTVAHGKLPSSPLEKAKLSFTRHFYRTLDFDNFVASLKPVCDALVHAGIIKDDNWKVTGAWDIHQVHRPKSEGPLLVVQVRGFDGINPS